MKRQFLITVVLLLLLTACGSEDAYDKLKISDDQTVLMDRDALSEINIKVDYQKPEVAYRKAEDGRKSKDLLCSLTYGLKVTNLNTFPIEVMMKVFISEEIRDTFLASSKHFGTEGRTVTLEPSKGLHMTAGLLIKHVDRHTKAEAAIFEEEFEKLEVVLIIDNEEYRLLLDGDDVGDKIEVKTIQ